MAGVRRRRAPGGSVLRPLEAGHELVRDGEHTLPVHPGERVPRRRVAVETAADEIRFVMSQINGGMGYYEIIARNYDIAPAAAGS